jgi:hypothetical protein
MAVKNPFKTTLVAPCGIDCAICSAYLRERNRCEGCRAPDRRFHPNCRIFSCDQGRKRFCYECAEYPCKLIRHLDKRYRTKYGTSMMENFKAIREHGIRNFLKAERERWTCKECGGVIDVHHRRCSVCGREYRHSGCT